jgi:sec-independent protein translocase protein TatA
VNLGPTELIVGLVIVMLLFGAARLPKLARSLGESVSEVRKGMADAELAADGSAQEDGTTQPSRQGAFAMKRFLLLLAALATLLVPAARVVAAPAHTDGESKIPAELCFAVTGSDVERTLCSG